METKGEFTNRHINISQLSKGTQRTESNYYFQYHCHLIWYQTQNTCVHTRDYSFSGNFNFILVNTYLRLTIAWFYLHLNTCHFSITYSPFKHEKLEMIPSDSTRQLETDRH